MKRSCALLLFFFGLSASACKIVKHDSMNKGSTGDTDIFFANTGFDPKAYVQEIWTPKIIPYIDNKAVGIDILLEGIKKADIPTLKKYGYKVGDEGSFYNFAVKGTFRVLQVNTESRNGLAFLDVYPFDGKEDCILQIGPVIKGSSIRDVLDFISLNSFENQVEFAKLATELNYQVRDVILKNLDLAGMAGKTYGITAVCTYEETGSLITLTPVAMQGTGE